METLKIGYARENFSPDKAVHMNSTKIGEKVMEPIFTTCLSLSQGDKRVLIIGMDLRNVYKHFTEIVIPQITEATGVPADAIIFHTPHNHSCPDASSTSFECVLDWRERIGFPAIVKAAVAAVADEKAVTGVFGANGVCENVSYVRRYQKEDGTYVGIATANKSEAPIVAHESEADPSLRVVRIAREGGKDVLLVNFQVHAAGALGSHGDSVCADFVGPLRDILEEKGDCLVMYYQGGCGNTNYATRIEEEKPFKPADYREAGQRLAYATREALAKEEPLQIGQLKHRYGSVVGAVNHTKDHLYDQAKAIGEEPDMEKRKEMMHAVGIDSNYVRAAIIKRKNMPMCEDIEVASVAFGDVAMTFCPFEMFDINAKQLRQASPYKMTFACSYSLNYRGYMPCHQMFPHGEYEATMCHYLPGTGENVVLGQLAQLQDMKNA